MAPLLASSLGFAYVDLDARIERDEGAAVSDLIGGRGDASFRAVEVSALERALEGEGAEGLVIACGGGILGREENRERLRRSAFVVWLDVPPETAAERIGTAGRQARPLLHGGDMVDRLREVERARRGAYLAAANATVDTAGKSAAEVADAVLAAWRARTAWDTSAS